MKLIKGRNSTYTVTVRTGDTVKDLSFCTVYFEIKNTIDSGVTLMQLTASVATPSNGVATFTLNSNIFSLIESRIYPYQIYYVDPLLAKNLIEIGSVTICDFNDADWEWTYPYFTGDTRQDMITAIISQVPYNSFTNADIFRWLSDGIKQFCRETDYNICYASRDTLYGVDTYLLPKSLINIIDVEVLNPTSLTEDWITLDSDRDWEQFDGKVKFLRYYPFQTKNDAGVVKLLSRQKFRLKASKYSQALTNDLQFIELPEDCYPAIVFYICWMGKLQDREPEEASKYEQLYLSQESKFKIKNNKDNVGTVFLTYAGQGQGVI